MSLSLVLNETNPFSVLASIQRCFSRRILGICFYHDVIMTKHRLPWRHDWQMNGIFASFFELHSPSREKKNISNLDAHCSLSALVKIVICRNQDRKNTSETVALVIKYKMRPQGRSEGGPGVPVTPLCKPFLSKQPTNSVVKTPWR